MKALKEYIGFSNPLDELDKILGKSLKEKELHELAIQHMKFSDIASFNALRSAFSIPNNMKKLVLEVPTDDSLKNVLLVTKYSGICSYKCNFCGEYKHWSYRSSHENRNISDKNYYTVDDFETLYLKKSMFSRIKSYTVLLSSFAKNPQFINCVQICEDCIRQLYAFLPVAKTRKQRTKLVKKKITNKELDAICNKIAKKDGFLEIGRIVTYLSQKYVYTNLGWLLL